MLFSLEVIEQYKSEIAVAKLDTVIKQLLEKSKSDKELHSQITLISTRFYYVKNQRLVGTLEVNEEKREFAKTAKDLLDILNDIEFLYLQNSNK